MGLFSLYLLIFYLTLSNIILCSGYKQFKLQGYDLCTTKTFKAAIDKVRVALGVGPKITLGERFDSGAIISQVWNSTSANYIKMNCKFHVEASKSKHQIGFYIVITKLKFRKDPATNSCIDYIEFVNGVRPTSGKICDQIGLTNDGAVAPFFYDERDNRFRILVSVDENVPIVEPLEIKLVITAHTKCRSNDDYFCDPNDPYSCISDVFKDDGIVNCRTEINELLHQNEEDSDIDSFEPRNIVISAITSFIFTMVGVGFCLWICWKYCLSVIAPQQTQQNSDSRTNAEVPTIELPQSPLEDINNSNPRSSSPKDLPPSYESLFPER